MIATQESFSTREDVRAKIEAILARGEFGERRSWLAQRFDEAIEKLAGWFSDLFGLADPATSRSVIVAMLWLAAALVVAAIVVRIARWLRARRDASQPRPLRPAEDSHAAGVAALRREARAAGERGDHLAALRLYFRALVLGLSERGELVYRDAWTNRELFERGAPRREVAPTLAALVPRLDAQSFGREPAGPEDVAKLASLCERLLGRGRA